MISWFTFLFILWYFGMLEDQLENYLKQGRESYEDYQVKHGD